MHVCSFCNVPFSCISGIHFIQELNSWFQIVDLITIYLCSMLSQIKKWQIYVEFLIPNCPVDLYFSSWCNCQTTSLSRLILIILILIIIIIFIQKHQHCLKHSTSGSFSLIFTISYDKCPEFALVQLFNIWGVVAINALVPSLVLHPIVLHPDFFCLSFANLCKVSHILFLMQPRSTSWCNLFRGPIWRHFKNDPILPEISLFSLQYCRRPIFGAAEMVNISRNVEAFCKIFGQKVSSSPPFVWKICCTSPWKSNHHHPLFLNSICI